MTQTQCIAKINETAKAAQNAEISGMSESTIRRKWAAHFKAVDVAKALGYV